MTNRELIRMTDLDAILHLDQVYERSAHTYRIKHRKTIDDLKRLDCIKIAQQGLVAWSRLMCILDQGAKEVPAEVIQSLYNEVGVADMIPLHYAAVLEEDHETIEEGQALRKEIGPARESESEAVNDLVRMIRNTSLKSWKASVKRIDTEQCHPCISFER